MSAEEDFVCEETTTATRLYKARARKRALEGFRSLPSLIKEADQFLEQNKEPEDLIKLSKDALKLHDRCYEAMSRILLWLTLTIPKASSADSFDVGVKKSVLAMMSGQIRGSIYERAKFKNYTADRLSWFLRYEKARAAAKAVSSDEVLKFIPWQNEHMAVLDKEHVFFVREAVDGAVDSMLFFLDVIGKNPKSLEDSSDVAETPSTHY
jgi:hypothetical protein